MVAHPHRTTLTFEFAAEPVARAIERSLRQEVGQIDDERSTTWLGRDGAKVELVIDAADLTALRAAANTWLSLVEVAERTAETVDF